MCIYIYIYIWRTGYQRDCYRRRLNLKHRHGGRRRRGVVLRQEGDDEQEAEQEEVEEEEVAAADVPPLSDHLQVAGMGAHVPDRRLCGVVPVPIADVLQGRWTDFQGVIVVVCPRSAAP